MKLKPIKISQAVHEQLVKDKEHFSEVIGIPFTLNSTINEYQKIVQASKKEDTKNAWDDEQGIVKFD